MRIAIVGPFFYPRLDRVEKVMLNHARYLTWRRHEVNVVTSRLRYPRGGFADVPAPEEMEGFTIHCLQVRLPNSHWHLVYTPFTR